MRRLDKATHALANQATITGEAGSTVLACLVVVAVFAPLPVRGYWRNL
jgi:ABC-2 type transport system permease protein